MADVPDPFTPLYDTAPTPTSSAHDPFTPLYDTAGSSRGTTGEAAGVPTTTFVPFPDDVAGAGAPAPAAAPNSWLPAGVAQANAMQHAAEGTTRGRLSDFIDDLTGLSARNQAALAPTTRQDLADFAIARDAQKYDANGTALVLRLKQDIDAANTRKPGSVPRLDDLALNARAAAIDKAKQSPTYALDNLLMDYQPQAPQSLPYQAAHANDATLQNWLEKMRVPWSPMDDWVTRSPADEAAAAYMSRFAHLFGILPTTGDPNQVGSDAWMEAQSPMGAELGQLGGMIALGGLNEAGAILPEITGLTKSARAAGLTGKLARTGENMYRSLPFSAAAGGLPGGIEGYRQVADNGGSTGEALGNAIAQALANTAEFAAFPAAKGPIKTARTITPEERSLLRRLTGAAVSPGKQMPVFNNPVEQKLWNAGAFAVNAPVRAAVGGGAMAGSNLANAAIGHAIAPDAIAAPNASQWANPEALAPGAILAAMFGHGADERAAYARAITDRAKAMQEARAARLKGVPHNTSPIEPPDAGAPPAQPVTQKELTDVRRALKAAGQSDAEIDAIIAEDQASHRSAGTGAAAAEVSRDNAATAAPTLALPAPAPIMVDRAGNATTPAQRAAQASRVAELGLTPDVVRAQQARQEGVKTAEAEALQHGEPGEFGAPEPEHGAAPIDPEVEQHYFDDIDKEIGWDQEGGHIIRGTADQTPMGESDVPFGENRSGSVTGRTAWIGMPRVDSEGESDFWRNRPANARLTPDKARAALAKARAGEPLKPIEQRFVDYAHQQAREYAQEHADEMVRYEQALQEQNDIERQQDIERLRNEAAQFTDADASDALTLHGWTMRALDAGVPDGDLAPLIGSGTMGERVQRLAQAIKQRGGEHGTDTGANGFDRAGNDSYAREGQDNELQPPRDGVAKASEGQDEGAQAQADVTPAIHARGSYLGNVRDFSHASDVLDGKPPGSWVANEDSGQVLFSINGHQYAGGDAHQSFAEAFASARRRARDYGIDLLPREGETSRLHGAEMRPRSDLFAPATGSERLRAAREAKDAERNGLNRPQQPFTNTDLGAAPHGEAPEQMRIPEREEPVTSIDLTPNERAKFEAWKRGEDAPKPVNEISESDLSPEDQELVRRTRANAAAAKDNADMAVHLQRESAERGERDADELGLRAPVEAIRGGRSDGRVHFVYDEDGLPAEVRKRSKPIKRGNVRYGLHTPEGDTYIFTKYANTPAKAVWTAVHEIGHDAWDRFIEANTDVRVGNRTVREQSDKTAEMALQNSTLAKVADKIGEDRRPDDWADYTPAQRARYRLQMVNEAVQELQAATRTGDWGEIEAKYGVKVPIGMRGGVKAAIANFVKRMKAILNAIVFKRTGQRDVFSDADVHDLLQSMWEAAKRKPGEMLGAEQMDQQGFHGGPHRGIEQDGFKLNKIGTGEGAQAYGWGIYFAGRRETAEGYRERLSGHHLSTIELHGKPLDTYSQLAIRLRNIDALMRDDHKSFEDAKRAEIEDMSFGATRARDNGNEARAAELDEAARRLREVGEHDWSAPEGQLYHAEIPEDHELLDWDKPLSEQPPSVRMTMERIGRTLSAEAKAELLERANAEWGDLTGREMYQFMSRLGSEGELPHQQEMIGDTGSGAEAASKYLNNEGIPGLRYLDGSSRSAGNGSHNYVIWDESRLNNDVTPYYSEEPAERDLIAQHNTTAEKLAHADRMGGLAVPSIGITRAAHPLEDYGDISLIGHKDIVDPRQGAKVFGADAYTPRYPEVKYKTDANVAKNVAKIIGKQPGERLEVEYAGSAENITHSPAFKRYAEEQLGRDYSYHESRALAEKVLREAGAKEVLFKGYTNAGYRKYLPHTLENVVKELKRNLRGGEGFSYGPGSVRAKFTPQFRSIEKIRAEKGKLVSKEDFDKIKENVNDDFFKVAHTLAQSHDYGNKFEFSDIVASTMEDAAKMGVDRALRENQFHDVTPEARAEFAGYLTHLKNLPTHYFEAIQPRAVGINEFRSAVIPSNAKPETRALLERHGLNIHEYDKNVEGDQARAVRDAARDDDLMFSEEPQDRADTMGRRVGGPASESGAPAELPPRAPGESPKAWHARIMRENKVKLSDRLKAMSGFGMPEEWQRMKKIGRNGMKGMWAHNAREADKLGQQFAVAMKVFDKAGEHANREAIHQWETGQEVTSAAHRIFFKAMEKEFQRRIDAIQAIAPGTLQHVIENYFPHLWEDPTKARKWYQSVFGKRPLEGGRSFLKQRVHMTLEDGIAAHLKPVSTNPVDLVLAKMGEMDRFLDLHRFRKDLQERGWLREMDAGERVPYGYARVDDPAFEKAAGLQGYFAVPEPIAKDLNNFLSDSLYKHWGWKQFRKLQNGIMMSRLGWSAFHAGFTTLDNLVLHASVGTSYALHGDLGRAFTTWARTPLSVLLSPVEGGRLGKVWAAQEPKEWGAWTKALGLGEHDANTLALLDALESGGAHWHMDYSDYNRSLTKFARAMRQHDWKRGAKSSLGAMGEASSWLIHQKLVPAQKMSARLLLAKQALDHYVPELREAGYDVKGGDYAGIIGAMNPDTLHQVMGDVVRNIDDRLGQMNYDNLFWNKTLREALQGAVGALGWQIGTVRTVTSGLGDIRRWWAPEKLVAALDKEGRVTDAHMPRISDRTTYLLSLALIMGGSNAALQYMMTGQGPTELKDYFFPKTGKKNADGSDERLQLPTYWMDHYKLATHTLQTAEHKIHPIWSMLMEAINNQDYWGVEVRDPHADGMKQAEQIAEFVGKGFMPYSVQNRQKSVRNNAGVGRQVANFFGVTTAPASVSRSDFQAFVSHNGNKGFGHELRTRVDAEHSQMIKGVIQQVRNGGKPDLSKLSRRDRMRVARESREQVPEIQFKKMDIEDKLEGWDMATPKERKEYRLRRDILTSRGTRTDRFRRLPEDERHAILQRILQIREARPSP